MKIMQCFVHNSCANQLFIFTVITAWLLFIIFVMITTGWRVPVKTQLAAQSSFSFTSQANILANIGKVPWAFRVSFCLNVTIHTSACEYIKQRKWPQGLLVDVNVSSVNIIILHTCIFLYSFRFQQHASTNFI